MHSLAGTVYISQEGPVSFSKNSYHFCAQVAFISAFGSYGNEKCLNRGGKNMASAKKLSRISLHKSQHFRFANFETV